MRIQLYNTLGREKKEFIPIDQEKKTVKMYSCGPTVYDYAHIGNLRTYIFSDILKRVLQYNNYQVQHVMNITDVGHLTDDADAGEDKMEKGARREGKSVWNIANYYTERFMENMKELNILEPNTWCKATDHIQEQIQQIQQIERQGYAYKTSEGIYFDTAKLNNYGELAQLKIESLEGGKRVELGEKRNKTDFALWKFSPKEGPVRQMEWDSPWGKGFPGWHIECSAMSSKYLGEHYDIHTGGIDHIPIHHTNEIAQAETAYEIHRPKRWVNYWLHGEFLTINKGRMGKSQGNFLTLQTLKDKNFDPLAYRYFCLTGHYKQQLSFSYEALEGAQHSYERIKNIISELKTASEQERQHIDSESQETEVQQYQQQFLEAINDDLNMPQALSILWEVLRDKSLDSKEKLRLTEQFDQVLGLKLLEEETIEIPEEVVELAKKREEARKNKDWTQADKLRDEIAKKGYEIKDGKEGFKILKN